MLETKCTTTETMQMEVISHFAKLHRVHTRRDECGELIISGKRGHIYEHSLDGKVFGVLLMLPTKRRWTGAKRKLALAGFTIRRNAETEGTALFDPADTRQSRLAIRLVGGRKLRKASQPSVAQEAARRLFSERARSNSGFRAPGTKQRPETTRDKRNTQVPVFGRSGHIRGAATV